ncbi:MAG: aspartate aminotransferase family protein [Pseudomonadota bacterium]|nr:aspartate aminotransferase family protein [Pseudomonadota bacterium]
MNQPAPHSPPAQSESDTNLSSRRAEWAARTHGPEARALLERDSRAFLHQSVSTPCLGTIARAEGIFIEDTAGRRYMDFHGNNVHHIGYGHPRLKAAIARQMDELPFAPRRFTCGVSVELAEKLAAITPTGLDKVLFSTGGSDAVEIALKVARLATGRHKTVSFWDSFHGAGFGASSVGGEELFRAKAFGPLLPGTLHVPAFDSYRDSDPLASAHRIAQILRDEGDIAAVVAEPMRVTTGHVTVPGFWKIVREACDRSGALLIFDEIPTGLGKTGRMFAHSHEGVIPDILVLGKGLGGGILPIAAVVCRNSLDVAGDYAIGHYTHEKNPVTARAALTTIQIIDDEGLVENARATGEYALARLKEMRKRHALIGDVRGRGVVIGIELVSDRQARAPAPDAAEAVLYSALDRGLSFKTTMGHILNLTPPLTTTVAQMDVALDIIDDCLVAAQKEKKG